MAAPTSRHTVRATCRYGANKPGEPPTAKEARAKSRIGLQRSPLTCSQFKNAYSRLHSSSWNELRSNEDSRTLRSRWRRETSGLHEEEYEPLFDNYLLFPLISLFQHSYFSLSRICRRNFCSQPFSLKLGADDL